MEAVHELLRPQVESRVCLRAFHRKQHHELHALDEDGGVHRRQDIRMPGHDDRRPEERIAKRKEMTPGAKDSQPLGLTPIREPSTNPSRVHLVNAPYPILASTDNSAHGTARPLRRPL